VIYLRCLLGLVFFCSLCWVFSSHRQRFPWRVVLWGLALQIGLGIWVLDTDSGSAFFNAIASFVAALIAKAAPGTELVFGPLAGGKDSGLGYIFAFASTGLIVIIFFSALMSVLYYLGLMQVLVWSLAKIMSTLMGVSGAESMAVAGEIFVGQTESPLLVRPYLPRMTKSELTAMMTGGYATIAGSVMAVYMGMLGKEYAPHLLTASVMSAPAAFVCAKILVPETEVAQTARGMRLKIDRGARNVIEAAANGTTDGLKLWLNVIAMLLAFTALIHLVDWPLESIGEWLSLKGGLSLSRIFGWLFALPAWATGVQGWHDSQLFGSLLGTKISLNEFVAYKQLSGMLPGSAGADTFEQVRSAKMVTYALCGFANFASIGIQIGGITPLAPERKDDIMRYTVKAMFAGAIATCMTATVAGVFL
jgi:concentrative nucleoside transporter, CNT family